MPHRRPSSKENDPASIEHLSGRVEDAPPGADFEGVLIDEDCDSARDRRSDEITLQLRPRLLKHLWAVASKANASMAEGYRLENLSWRLWHSYLRRCEPSVVESLTPPVAAILEEIQTGTSVPLRAAPSCQCPGVKAVEPIPALHWHAAHPKDHTGTSFGHPHAPTPPPSATPLNLESAGSGCSTRLACPSRMECPVIGRQCPLMPLAMHEGSKQPANQRCPKNSLPLANQGVAHRRNPPTFRPLPPPLLRCDRSESTATCSSSGEEDDKEMAPSLRRSAGGTVNKSNSEASSTPSSVHSLQSLSSAGSRPSTPVHPADALPARRMTPTPIKQNARRRKKNIQRFLQRYSVPDSTLVSGVAEETPTKPSIAERPPPGPDTPKVSLVSKLLAQADSSAPSHTDDDDEKIEDREGEAWRSGRVAAEDAAPQHLLRLSNFSPSSLQGGSFFFLRGTPPSRPGAPTHHLLPAETIAESSAGTNASSGTSSASLFLGKSATPPTHRGIDTRLDDKQEPRPAASTNIATASTISNTTNATNTSSDTDFMSMMLW